MTETKSIGPSFRFSFHYSFIASFICHMKAEQDANSDALEMTSLCNNFQFQHSDDEAVYVTQMIDVETYIAFCLLLLTQHTYDFVSATARWGAGLHNLLLVVVPVIIVMLGPFCLRWSWAFRRIPQFMSISILVGFATQMASLHWQVPLQARDFLETIHGPKAWDKAMLHSASRLASSQLLVPRLIFVGLLGQFTAAVPYNKINLFVHVSLPLAMGLTTLLSPNVYFDVFELIAFASLMFFTLLLNMRKTLSSRKRFVAELAARDAMGLGALKEGRVAHSILCHKVKNAVVDASTLIESALQDPEGPSLPMLSQAQGRLQNAMQWFGREQMIMQLRGAHYCQRVEAVDLAACAWTVLSGRAARRHVISDTWAMLDRGLFEFLLDSVVTNATKHGYPGASDIAVGIDLHPVSDNAHPYGPHRRLVVHVTNRANPAKPAISQELVSKALEAERHCAMLGLQCIFMAANALGMTASLTQEGETVSFMGLMDTQVTGNDRASQETSLSIPVGLTVCCIDDNEVARRFMSVQLTLRFPDCTSHVFGEALSDVVRFRKATLEEADIAILDQHLEYEGVTVLGTTIITELLAEGFQGLLCIRSANTSEADVALYQQSGAHCVIDKALPAARMVRQIVTSYNALRTPPPRCRSWSTLSSGRQAPGIGTSPSASSTQDSGSRLAGSRSAPPCHIGQHPLSNEDRQPPLPFTQTSVASAVVPSNSLPIPSSSGDLTGELTDPDRQAPPPVPRLQPFRLNQCVSLMRSASTAALRAASRITTSDSRSPEPDMASLLIPADDPSHGRDSLALANAVPPGVQALPFGVVPRQSADWQDAASSASTAAARTCDEQLL